MSIRGSKKCKRWYDCALLFENTQFFSISNKNNKKGEIHEKS